MVDGARRPPDRFVLSLSVKLMEWARPTEDAPALDQEIAWALIIYWRPFNKRDPSIAYMRELVGRNTPSLSSSAWIRGHTRAWLRTGCICATMTSMRLLNWYG